MSVSLVAVHAPLRKTAFTTALQQTARYSGRSSIQTATVRAFSASVRRREDISEIKVSDRLNLNGRNILVTGGGRGIGFAVCKAIAQQGGNVAVLDALPEPVEEFHQLASKHSIKTSYQQTDVTKQDSLESAFAAAVEKTGPITGCVPAAGVAVDKPMAETTWQEAERVLMVNTMGTFWTVKLAADHMAAHGLGGSIVMIASIAAQGIKVPEQNLSIYNMSKAGVKGLVGPLAVELGEQNIRVNSVSPGVIMSPMTDAMKTSQPKLLNMFKNAAPMGRIGIPQDLTPQIIYLLSDAASFTTGADFIISGGIHAGVAPTQMSKALSG